MPTWAFDTFWRSLAAERPQARWGKMNASLNAIYRAVGRTREIEVVSEFERKSLEQRPLAGALGRGRAAA